MRPRRARPSCDGDADDLAAEVEQHQQVAQVAREEGHLVGAAEDDPLGARDRLDRRGDLVAVELARGLLDVRVVGRERGLELGLVDREERRGRRALGAACRSRAGGGTRRARTAGARGSPRTRAPARSGRPSSSRCWRGGQAPPPCGRRPRRGGRRCTGRRPSASARTPRSGSGSRQTGSVRKCRCGSRCMGFARGPAVPSVMRAGGLRRGRSGRSPGPWDGFRRRSSSRASGRAGRVLEQAEEIDDRHALRRAIARISAFRRWTPGAHFGYRTLIGGTVVTSVRSPRPSRADHVADVRRRGAGSGSGRGRSCRPG